MTFCAAMRVKEGLVAISDTRITAGSECREGKKMTIHQVRGGKHSAFLMTSGLRGLRDKAVIYFQEMIEEHDIELDKMYKMVNAFGALVRRVAEEDKKSLEESGFKFNINALIGGQLENDDEHKLFMVFPEGNWVEVGQASPYFIIGNSSHGKPMMDRVLRYDSSLDYALKVGFLSFNATRISANDVEYPIDVTIYKKDSYQMLTHRYERQDLEPYSQWWQEKIAKAIDELPNDWVDPLFQQMEIMNL